MNLKNKINTINNSPLTGIISTNLNIDLFEQTSLHIWRNKNIFISVQNKKIDCKSLQSNGIVFIDAKTEYPRTTIKNFSEIIRVENPLVLESLQNNGYNCILPQKTKNVLETIGSGSIIIYSYIENRVLKEILDFKKCTLVIMSKNEKNLECKFNIDLILPEYQIELMNYLLQKKDYPLIPELANFALNQPISNPISRNTSYKKRLKLSGINVNIIPDDNWALYFEIEQYLLKEFPEIIIFSEDCPQNFYLEIIKNDFKYQKYLTFLQNKKTQGFQ